MKKSIITLLLLSFGISTQAQMSPGVNPGQMEGFRINTKKSTEEITGSPYLEETFRAAKVEGSTVTLVRYNIHSGQLEFAKDNETWGLSPKKDVVISTTDGKYSYVYTDYVFDGASDTGYLLLLKDLPKIKLYALHRVSIQEAVISNGYQAEKPAAYKRADVKYLARIGDSASATEIPTKKKDLVKMFPGKEAQINDFFKNNKVNEKDDSMIKLAEFLDTII